MGDDAPPDTLRRKFNATLLFVFTVFQLQAFYSIAYAYKRLMRKGISMTARNQFFLKHTGYVYMMLFMWTVQLINNY